MTDRSSMDRPATAVAASLGVLLILVSTALFVFTGTGAGGGEGGTRYSMAWSQSEGDSDSAAFGAEGASGTAMVAVDGRNASNITVLLGPCNDDRGTPEQPAAEITWTLTNGTETLDEGTATCADVGELVTIPLAGHPDRAEVRSGSIGAAREEAWSGASNYTAEYTLTFTYQRDDSPVPIPIPVGQPQLSGNMGLRVEEWQVTVTERPDEQEAPR